MRALIFDGELRFVENYPDPQPGDGEVLIKVIQAGICSTDLEIVRGYLQFKGIPGHEFVGTVVEGPNELKAKRVVGEINCVCHECDMCRAGLASHCRNRTVLGIAGRNGAFAEYLTLPRENVHVLPPELTDDQAVFVEPLAAAVRTLCQYPFKSIERVAVLGPGRLGLLVAQVLRPHVSQLTLIGRSSSKAPLCKALGIPLALNDSPLEKGMFDVVVECTGNADGFALAQNLVRPAGTIILKSTYAGESGPNLALTVINEIRIIGSRCGPFDRAIDCLAADKVRVEPMISGRYGLPDGVEAFVQAARSQNTKILIKVSR